MSGPFREGGGGAVWWRAGWSMRTEVGRGCAGQEEKRKCWVEDRSAGG